MHLYCQTMADLTREEVIEKVKKGENLEKADLNKLDLSDADLSSAYLVGANLSETNLGGANFSHANLKGANLSSTYLVDANFIDAYLVGADLSGAYLKSANLTRAILVDANLSSADLSIAYLSGTNLKGANLSSTYLVGANLSRAILVGANLCSAKLSIADLSGANLSETNLSGATLNGANLCSTNLSNTDLKDSNLVSVDFEYADLTEADISGANIFHYKTHGWKIEGIKCTHVYNYSSYTSIKEREKSRINFEKGQFEEKYKAMPTIELLLSGGLRIPDLYKMYKTIEKMNKKYNAGLELSEMKSELNGIAYTLKAKSDEDLEEIGRMIVREYKNRDLDSKLLVTIRKEKLLGTGTEGFDINTANIDDSKVFSRILEGKVNLLNKGTINLTQYIIKDVKDSALALAPGATTTMINNYANNKEEIDKTLKEFKELMSEEVQQQLEVLTGALKEEKEKEALGIWEKIKKMVAKADEVVKTGEKSATLPKRAIELYHKLEGWFEAGLNLVM